MTVQSAAHQEQRSSSKKALAVALTATLLLVVGTVGYISYSSVHPTDLSSLHEARRLYSYGYAHKAAKMEAHESRLRGQAAPRSRMEGQALPTYSTTSTVKQSSTVKRIGVAAKMEAQHHSKAVHEPRMEGQALPTYSTSSTITQSSTVKRIGILAKMESEYRAQLAKMEELPSSYTYGGRISGRGESISLMEAKAAEHKEPIQH